jgi:carbamoyl-phosphate synthase large subunit
MTSQKYRILTESCGSLTSGYLTKAIKSLGHVCVCSDISSESAGRFLGDEFVIMPRASDKNLWEKISEIVVSNKIDIVIPSFDETLLDWASYKKYFAGLQVHVITSPQSTIEKCLDKWKTFQFFESYGVPTPRTSLIQDYELIKPRFGRGSKGILLTNEQVSMQEKISQEVLDGTEFTIDIFCNSGNIPMYIVPRRRLRVVDGKSTAGIVEENEVIASWVRKICSYMPFIGPINMQCFILPDGKVKFIEINPRIGGGMALGFAATENWVNLIVENLVEGFEITPKKVINGMRMERYYDEIFIPGNSVERN